MKLTGIVSCAPYVLRVEEECCYCLFGTAAPVFSLPTGKTPIGLPGRNPR